MIEVRETAEFAEWFRRLQDRRARARIDARIRRVSLGNFGDVKPVGEGVKGTQERDVEKALELARNL